MSAFPRHSGYHKYTVPEGFHAIGVGASRFQSGAVGAGGNQRRVDGLAQPRCQWMSGDANGDAGVVATQPGWGAASGRKQPGDGAGPGGRNLSPLFTVEGRGIGLQLAECCADQDQSLALRPPLYAQESHDCPSVAGVAAQAVAGLGGVGDHAALFEVATQFADQGGIQCRC